jgi:hypothetical protein
MMMTHGHEREEIERGELMAEHTEDTAKRAKPDGR